MSNRPTTGFSELSGLSARGDPAIDGDVDISSRLTSFDESRTTRFEPGVDPPASSQLCPTSSPMGNTTPSALSIATYRRTHDPHVPQK